MKCELCKEEHKSLDKHHVHSKSLGGNNKKYNLINLCCNCHRAVHKDLYVIEGKFSTTNGSMWIWHKKDEDSITGYEPPVHLM